MEVEWEVKALIRSGDPRDQFDDITKLPLQLTLIKVKLFSQVLNTLTHDLVALLVLPDFLVHPLLHGALRLGEPKQHVGVV